MRNLVERIFNRVRAFATGYDRLAASYLTGAPVSASIWMRRDEYGSSWPAAKSAELVLDRGVCALQQIQTILPPQRLSEGALEGLDIEALASDQPPRETCRLSGSGRLAG